MNFNYKCQNSCTGASEVLLLICSLISIVYILTNMLINLYFFLYLKLNSIIPASKGSLSKNKRFMTASNVFNTHKFAALFRQQ